MSVQERQKSVTPKPEKPKKRDRAKHRCSTALEEIIRLVNSVPPDRKLPHREEILAQVENDRIKQLDCLKQLLQGVSADFIKQNGGVYGAYAEFRNLRRAIRSLADLAQVPAEERELVLIRQNYEHWDSDATREINPKYPLNNWGDHSGHDLDINSGVPGLPGFRQGVRISPTGQVETFILGAAAKLIGIDASRLRVCANCRQIYWAKLSNSVACGQRCTDANRQRLFRERKQQYSDSTKKKPASKQAKK